MSQPFRTSSACDLTPGPSPRGEGRKTDVFEPLSSRRGVGVRSVCEVIS
jgi:hypothetical protein